MRFQVKKTEIKIRIDSRKANGPLATVLATKKQTTCSLYQKDTQFIVGFSADGQTTVREHKYLCKPIIQKQPPVWTLWSSLIFNQRLLSETVKQKTGH